jgi:hypothetical protein
MRESRRFTLGFLLVLTLALSSFSGIPLVYAEVDAEIYEESGEGAAETLADSSGELQMEEPEAPEVVEDDTSVAEAAAAEAASVEEAAAAEAAATQAAAEAEAAAAQAAAEAEAAAEPEAAAAASEAGVVEEAGKEKGTSFVGGVLSSAKTKAVAFVDRTKEISPDQMKKVAAGALGIWGVAAGAGWVMNHFGGSDE